MERFKNYTDAENAAIKFFSETFGHTSGAVGIESQDGIVIEYYSKDDPGMDDTFTCKVCDEKALISFQTDGEAYYWDGRRFDTTGDLTAFLIDKEDAEKELEAAKGYVKKMREEDNWIITPDDVYITLHDA